MMINKEKLRNCGYVTEIHKNADGHLCARVWNKDKSEIIYGSNKPHWTYTWKNFYQPALIAISNYDD